MAENHLPAPTYHLKRIDPKRNGLQQFFSFRKEKRCFCGGMKLARGGGGGGPAHLFSPVHLPDSWTHQTASAVPLPFLPDICALRAFVKRVHERGPGDRCITSCFYLLEIGWEILRPHCC